jgi:hypothetical protein
MMIEGASLRAVSRLPGVPAVAEHFGENIDFAQLVKTYARPNTIGPVSHPGCYKMIVTCPALASWIGRSSTESRMPYLD